MKKFCIISFLLLGAAVSVFAQLDPFMPVNPITFAQGGAFTANAEGMNAFFYNPAGFKNDEGELTLTTVGVYSLIDRSLLTLVMDMIGVSSDSSRSSDDFELEGLESLEVLADDLTVIADWMGSLSEDQLNAAIDAAVDTIAEYDQSLAESIGDADSLTEEELTALVLQANIFGDSDDNDTSNLVDILAAMNTAAVAEGATDIEDSSYLGADGLDSVDDNVDEAADDMPSGEMRIGALAGIAYVGHGFGFGLFASADGTFEGETILDSVGRMMTAITFAGGYAFDLGPFTVGAQLRPTILGYTDVYPSLFLAEQDVDAMFSDGVYTGFYLGLDAGALYDLGPFTFGVALKDMLPLPIQWSSYEDYEAYMAGVSSGKFLGSGSVDEDDMYQVPALKVNVGAQYHPDLGGISWIVDPRINVDIQDLFGFLRYVNAENVQANKATLGDSYDFLEHIHLGAEAAFFGGGLSARAGLYGDYLTAGIGAHLLFLDVNAAVGASELKKTSEGWAFQQLGLAFEAAIRF